MVKELNIKAKNEVNPLHLAALIGKLEFVEILLKKGADSNAVEPGISVLMEPLINYGARYKIYFKITKRSEHDTPLIHVVKSNKIKSVEILLKSKSMKS